MTRYPKAGKGRKWTVIELKSLPQDWAGDVINDSDGLFGDIRKAGDGTISVRFRYSYRWDEKLRWHQCGTWPTVSLEEIRRARDAARALVKDGVDPNDHKKAAKIERQAAVEAVLAKAAAARERDLPLREMYSDWLEGGVVRQDDNKEIKRAFEKDLLPELGDIPVRSITEKALRGVLLKVVERGSHRMAVRLHNDLVQLFAWAELRKPWRNLLLEGNPTRLLELHRIVPSEHLRSERDRVLSATEIRELSDIFRDMALVYERAPRKYDVPRPLQDESQLALWICLGTACRIGELLMSKWTDVDLEGRLWRIPVENVKKTKGKQKDHLVHLSDFSLRQFQQLHAITGKSEWCFPSRDGKDHVCVKSVSKQVGDRQNKFKERVELKKRRNDDTLVLSKGAGGAWTPHDLRRTAATMMQALGVALDVIDRCQGHVLAGSRVRRHYLHHDYSQETQLAWTALGDKLEEILQPQPNAETSALIEAQ